MPAPLLEQLSFRQAKATSSTVSMVAGFNASNYPRLSCFQFVSIKINSVNLDDMSAIQSLRTFSIDGVKSHGIWPASFCNFLPRVTTFNLELASWDGIPVHGMLHANMRRMNIRWTKSGFFDPIQAVPSPETWNSLQSLHITHVGESSGDPLPANLNGMSIPIPAQFQPFRNLQVRTSGTSGRKVHICVVHGDGRERVLRSPSGYCLGNRRTYSGTRAFHAYCWYRSSFTQCPLSFDMARLTPYPPCVGYS